MPNSICIQVTLPLHKFVYCNCITSHSRANSDDDWKLVSTDKDMKVYIREVEEDGAICDPVKAVTTVQVDYHKYLLMS